MGIADIARAEADAFVDEVWEDVVQDIASLVAIESVEDLEHAAPGMPFGPQPRRALDEALSIAQRLGLEPHNADGYIGFADLPGASETQIATIAHSDIVPLGEGWTVPPLEVSRREGYLLGRGVADDKGPLVLSLYTAHFFVRLAQRTGQRLPYTLRCLIGASEETSMADVHYYLAHYPEPAFCFTPDAMFPLICGEKGHYGVTLRSAWIEGGEGRIVDMRGGTAPNAIPGSAWALVRADARELPQAPRIRVEDAGADDAGARLAKVTATGRGGHASLPEGTVNAIGLLVDYLMAQGLAQGAELDFLRMEQIAFADTAGKAWGIDATDDLFDPLTCIGGTIRCAEDAGCRRFEQTLDSRYPKSTTAQDIHRRVSEVAAGFGCTAEMTSDMVPFYQEPDSAPIRVLVDTYNEVYGRHDEPLTIGGGTYARHFTHACAFGPLDLEEDVPTWVGGEHGPDEGVSEAALRRALKIYIVAVARLMELDL